jgi:UDP-N-acetylmuramate dehydrogenase
VRPRSLDDLRGCLDLDPSLRVLGDGANLLVDDPGVAELVISMDAPEAKEAEIDAPSGLVRARAGARLPGLINRCVREGLAGLEVLAGFPASIGGAIMMNAGGAFGEIASVVERVHALDRRGNPVTLERREIPFAYRRSGLGRGALDLIVWEAELRLTPSDRAALDARRREIMEYKKSTQPMSENSAGCCFKNPVLSTPLPSLGPVGEKVGQRVSAGLLIDRAGCKGLAVGGARVSEHHANFITTSRDARARHVIDLMDEVARRVHAAFGVTLEREVVVWERGA